MAFDNAHVIQAKVAAEKESFAGMEEVGCPLCGAFSDQVCWRESGYTGRRCDSCALIYLSPRPDETEMAALYDEDKAGGESAKGHIVAGYDKKLDAQLALRWLRRYARGPRLLEIGPGGGHLLTAARSAGFEPHAVEINSGQASYLQHQLEIPVFHGTITDKACFPSGRFDVIVHSDVLSHLHDPLTAFANMNKHLNPNGVMIFETGNAGDLSNRWLQWMGRLSFPEHVVLMGQRSILQLLKRTSFFPVARQAYSIVPWLLAVRLYHRLQLRNATNDQERDNTFAKEHVPEDNDRSASETNTKMHAVHPWSLAQRWKGRAIHALRYWASRPLPSNWPATVWYVARRL